MTCNTTWCNMVMGSKENAPACAYCGVLLNHMRKSFPTSHIIEAVDAIENVVGTHALLSTYRNIAKERTRRYTESYACSCCHHFTETRLCRGSHILPLFSLYTQLQFMIVDEKRHLDTRIVHKLARNVCSRGNYFLFIFSHEHQALIKKIANQSMTEVTRIISLDILQRGDSTFFVHNARMAELLREKVPHEQKEKKN